jgi:ABC-type Fe3+ transport system permease subunit
MARSNMRKIGQNQVPRDGNALLVDCCYNPSAAVIAAGVLDQQSALTSLQEVQQEVQLWQAQVDSLFVCITGAVVGTTRTVKHQ